MILELALRRLEGVDKVSISIPKQTISVTFKSGARFDPGGIREAVAKADVEVVRFSIAAKGQVQREGTQRFFVAGKDRFLLENSPNVPTGIPLSILGLVNDATDPLELQIRQSKPLEQ